MLTLVVMVIYYNTAEYFGGAVMISLPSNDVPAHCGNALSHSPLTNSATYTSGVSTRIDGSQSYQMFKQSVVFINNRAKFGGGIMSVQGNLSLLGNIKFHSFAV